MKKFIFILSICIIVITGCNTTGEKKESSSSKSENHNIISSAELPAAVLASFKTKYKNAADVKWEKAQEEGKPSYKAKWKIDGKKIKAEFAEDGSFIKEKQE